MFTPGKLIYFDPFHFKQGGPPKPKYFLVLKLVEDDIILVCLPSSVNHLPRDQNIAHGCLEIPDACINCYVFAKDKPVTKDGWSFSRDTFLYGNWLDDFSLTSLSSKYPYAGVDYEVIGEMTDAELKQVIQCFSNSSTVKNKYKKWLRL